MKTFLAISILLILNSFNLLAQWLPEYRLTNSAGHSTNTEIASNENYLHVVWQETRDGNHEIYYKRSTDYGVSWETDVRLTNTVGISSLPSISISGTFIYVVWQDFLNGNTQIYFKRSSDNGVSWGGDIALTNPGNLGNPIVSASGQFVHFIWRAVSNGFFEIFHKRSSDWGATWSGDSQLTTHTLGLAGITSFSTTGLNIHIAWADSRTGPNEISYKRSTDGGETWETEIPLTNNASYITDMPSITSLSTEVHITWVDPRGGNTQIYHKRSTDGGTTWGADIRLSPGDLFSRNPRIVLSGTIIHLAWEYGPSSEEIFDRRAMESGVSWEDSTQLSTSGGGVSVPAISTSETSTHVVWTDYRHGSTNHEIYYKHNPTGNITSVRNPDSEIPTKFSLLQNYPNPFNPSTTIRYAIPNVTLSGSSRAKSRDEGSLVTLKIYDVLGNEIASLVNEEKPAGSYEVDFNASFLSSGIYFYKLQAGSFIETKKMVLLR